MIGLLPYIDQVVKFVSHSSPGGDSQKIEAEKVIFWMAFLLAIFSYVMIMAGIGVYLVSRYDASIALLSIGLITLSTMFLMLALYRFYLHIRRQKIQRKFKEIADELSGMSNEILSKFDDGVKDNALLIAGVSAVLGYVVSRKVF